MGLLTLYDNAAADRKRRAGIPPLSDDPLFTALRAAAAREWRAQLAANGSDVQSKSISRMRGPWTGSSFAFLNSSSNFLASTSLCTLCSATDF